MLNKIKIILPYIVLIAVCWLLYRGLFLSTDKFSSRILNDPLPNFSLPNLIHPNEKISQTNLQNGIVLLNFWASWCYACSLEQHMLVKISRDNHVAIVGINYKDERTKALAWLKKYGNPYQQIAADQDGTLVTDLGVYGIPETFVVKNGRILYRHIGVINEENWRDEIYPVIQKNR